MLGHESSIRTFGTHQEWIVIELDPLFQWVDYRWQFRETPCFLSQLSCGSWRKPFCTGKNHHRKSVFSESFARNFTKLERMNAPHVAPQLCSPVAFYGFAINL
ncbi:hypothetical protein F1559_004721 [Cyanidiococcus yangmingshanensis]|uniref:Uncharacterized protein n=1 Tax=Cyanidiococcus yangmingshanensis TaxID=2690220 RepID=A0A7J7IKZ3_9RHOD|nr:hypothetical protein F1559_004721 [Cyanidiococcus yangmingshanensis]